MIRIVTALLCLLLLPLTAFAQAPVTLLNSGYWSATQGVDARHQPFCAMSLIAPGAPGRPGRFIIIDYTRNDRDLRVRLGEEDWNLPKGFRGHITFTMTTADEVPFGGDVTGINPTTTSPAMQFLIHQPMVQAWEIQLHTQQNLYFMFEDPNHTRWTIPLAGAGPVDDAFAACAKRINGR